MEQTTIILFIINNNDTKSLITLRDQRQLFKSMYIFLHIKCQASSILSVIVLNILSQWLLMYSKFFSLKHANDKCPVQSGHSNCQGIGSQIQFSNSNIEHFSVFSKLCSALLLVTINMYRKCTYNEHFVKCFYFFLLRKSVTLWHLFAYFSLTHHKMDFLISFSIIRITFVYLFLFAGRTSASNQTETAKKTVLFGFVFDSLLHFSYVFLFFYSQTEKSWL